MIDVSFSCLLIITTTITIMMINDCGRLHHDNKNVIRNFLFLGFQPIAPGALQILMMMVIVAIVVVLLVIVIVHLDPVDCDGGDGHCDHGH